MDKKLKISISCAIAVIVLGTCIYTFGSLNYELKRLSLKYNAKEQSIQEARRIMESIGITGIKSAVMTEEDISHAINELTQYGETKGIDFISITPKEKRKEGPYEVLPIEIEQRATYKDLGVFCGSLAELKKSLITIKSFNIFPDKEDLEKLRIKLTILIYLSG